MKDRRRAGAYPPPAIGPVVPLAAKRRAGVPDARTTRRPESAHDLVMRRIGLAIVSGEYPAGTLLPTKDVLTEKFRVSNSTLREAMQKLVAKGMILAKTKVGTRVLEPRHWNMFDGDILDWRFQIGVDHAFLGQLFELRQTFEPMAAALMARRANAAQVAELRALAQKMRAAEGERNAFAEADLAFHLLILDASGNPFLQSIGALIRTALAAAFAISAPTDDAQRQSLSEAGHVAIAEAIAAGNPAAAATAMSAVIEVGWESLGQACSAVLTHVALRDYRGAA